VLKIDDIQTAFWTQVYSPNKHFIMIKRQLISIFHRRPKINASSRIIFPLASAQEPVKYSHIASCAAAFSSSSEGFSDIPGVKTPGDKYVLVYTCSGSFLSV
jgi:hypothetical protein